MGKEKPWSIPVMNVAFEQAWSMSHSAISLRHQFQLAPSGALGERTARDRVCLAHDERGVADRLAAGPFRVILLDMRLPDTDGAAVFRKVQQTNP
jgi:CheY-like chemotaxis protein